MKKMLVAALVCMLLVSGAAVAEGMGVQIIGGDNLFTEQVSLDDVKLETPVEVDGWGTFTATEGKFVDELRQYDKGRNDPYYHTVYDSGLDAEYFVLKADILNTTTAKHNFLSDCEVKVVFNDSAEFIGWCYQYNWNNEVGRGSDYFKDTENIQNKEMVIAVEDQFDTESWYAGHFCFGCTLPNAVVESDAPLAMIITIDGNEITYNIRK